MAIVIVKPAAGLKIRMPERQMRHLSEVGEPVEMNEYWRRRLKDGDVVKVDTKGEPKRAHKKEA